MPAHELGRTWLRESDAWRSLATGERVPDPGAAPDGWAVLYQSDFSTNDGWTARQETQNNDNSYNHPDNVSYGSRGMVIEGKRENRGGRPFTTGDVTGQHITVPNYFRAEVTATLPIEYGMWPCPLWFRPLNSNDGEIDVCETWTYAWTDDPRPPEFWSTIHQAYDVQPQHKNARLRYSDLPDPDPAAPHTYVVEKKYRSIAFWCDGVLVWHWTPPDIPDWYDSIMEVPGKAWYPRVTLQIGGTGNPEPPAEWQQSEVIIHSMRIYQEAS